MCGPDFWAMGCRKILSRYLTEMVGLQVTPFIPTCADNFLPSLRDQGCRSSGLVDSITVGLLQTYRVSGSYLIASEIIAFSATPPFLHFSLLT